MKVKTLILLSLAMPVSAFAYLDPGTGSMLLQVILGGIAAVAVAIKLFWYRILAMLGIKKKADDAGSGGAGSTGTESDAKDKDTSNTGGGGGWD